MKAALFFGVVTVCLLAVSPDGGVAGSTWRTGDGGVITDAGATDVVTLTRHGRVRVKFEAPSMMSTCDADIVHLEADLEGITFVADGPGRTQCGFWLVDGRRSTEPGARPFPDRLVDVVIQ